MLLMRYRRHSTVAANALSFDLSLCGALFVWRDFYPTHTHLRSCGSYDSGWDKVSRTVNAFNEFRDKHLFSFNWHLIWAQENRVVILKQKAHEVKMMMTECAVGERGKVEREVEWKKRNWIQLQKDLALCKIYTFWWFVIYHVRRLSADCQIQH